MKYMYTFISSGCWGEDTYCVYEHSDPICGGASKLEGRYPFDFIAWWTGNPSFFSDKRFVFHTDRCINTAFNDWILGVVKRKLEGRTDEYIAAVLAGLVRDHYAKCAANLNNGGPLAQFNYLLTHGISQQDILRAFAVEGDAHDDVQNGAKRKDPTT